MDIVPTIRPACALPYELYADGNLSEDGTHYELHLSAAKHVHGAKSAGSPFNVYLRYVCDQSGRYFDNANSYVYVCGIGLLHRGAWSEWILWLIEGDGI